MPDRPHLRSPLSRAAGKLTYANVTATLALFIALGGVSWAAVTLPRNSVGSKQIKKNAVSTSKVKNRSLTGADVKGNTLKGAQIDEGSLAKVPAAAAADVAGTSADRFTLVFRENVSASNPSQPQARAYAAEIPIVSHGPISTYGKCYEVGTTVWAEMFVRTTVDGSFGGYRWPGADFLDNPPLNVSTPAEDQRIIARHNTAASTATFAGGGGVYLSPTGTGLSVGASIFLNSAATNPSLFFPSQKSCVFVVEGTRIG